MRNFVMNLVIALICSASGICVMLFNMAGIMATYKSLLIYLSIMLAFSIIATIGERINEGHTHRK